MAEGTIPHFRCWQVIFGDVFAWHVNFLMIKKPNYSLPLMDGPDCSLHSHLVSLAMSLSEPQKLLQQGSPVETNLVCCKLRSQCFGADAQRLFLSVIDYIELHAPSQAETVNGISLIGRPFLRINSCVDAEKCWIRLPIHDADFG
ncbi:unnamed protein product [Prunus brigantina]